MEITPTTKVPVKMLFNWARQRYEQNDKSPFVQAIYNDVWFSSSILQDDGPSSAIGSASLCESSMCSIIANYWSISQFNIKDTKIPQQQYIPMSWMKFLWCVNKGEPYYDESLHKLLLRAGFPYLDLNGELKYHYMVEVINLNQSGTGSDSNLHQATQQWRSLPHLFSMLSNYEPLLSNLKKHRENYISQSFFITFVNIMPFLYWAAQAYALSIEHSIPINIRDSLEVDGKYAFNLLFDHMSKARDTKDSPQVLFDMVLLICQALTHGTALPTSERSIFVNRLLAYLGERKYFAVNDVLEFLLCADWNSFMTSDLTKQTKTAAKKFYSTSPWSKVPDDDSPSSLIVIEKGVQIWQDEFLRTTSGFEILHSFFSSPPALDGCSIM